MHDIKQVEELESCFNYVLPYLFFGEKCAFLDGFLNTISMDK